MAKRKRASSGLRKRKASLPRIVLVVTLILLFMGLILNFPVLGHIKEVRSALDRYDVEGLSGELAWISENASWLKKVPLIRDGEIWLELNQGEYKDLEARLTQFKDDKHRFWLFQAHLLMEQENKAQQDISALQSSSLHALAEGILLAQQGDEQKASVTLQASKDSELNQEAKVLKYISLARLEMSRGDLDRAQEAWKRASEVSSNYPLVIETEYDLALVSGQWGKAKELSLQLEKFPRSSSQADVFRIKKALLALTVGERQVYQQILEELGTRENGVAYVDYLSGIELYGQGKFKEAAENFQNSLDRGLTNPIRSDAESALTQAKERTQAESALNQAKKQP